MPESAAQLVQSIDPDLRAVTEFAGAQGRSVRVRDAQGRDLLLKVVPEGTEVDEARHAAALQHPRIPTVHQVGHLADGRSFVLRDFVAGEARTSLSRDPSQLVAQLLQILEVVGFVHHRGLLHLDLKPSNLVADEHERLHLLDFGMAVRKGMRAIGGTPFFAAPEILLGVTPDARADLFSIGAMAVHALFAERLSLREVVRKLPGSGLLAACGVDAAELPTRMARFVTGCTSTDRERRFPDVAAALDSLCDGSSGRPSIAMLRPNPLRVFAAEIATVQDARHDVLVVGADADSRRSIGLQLAATTNGTHRVDERVDCVRVVRDGIETTTLRLPDLDAKRLSPHLRSALGLEGQTATRAAEHLLRDGNDLAAVTEQLEQLVRTGDLLPSGSRWSWPNARRGIYGDGEHDTVDGSDDLPRRIQRAVKVGCYEQARAMWLEASGAAEPIARRALVEGLLAVGEPAKALPLAADMPHLRTRALLDSGMFDLAKRELDACDPADDEQLVQARAKLAVAHGDLPSALRLLERNDLDLLGRIMLAALLEQSGRLDECERTVQSCRDVLDEEAEPFAAASLNTIRGHLARRQGDFETARTWFERAARLAERVGHLRHMGSSLLNLGVIAKDLGRNGEAIAHLREARTLCGHAGDRARAAVATANLGIAALERSDLDTARESLQEAVGQLTELGDAATARFARVMLARVHARDGRKEAAEAILAAVGQPDSDRLRQEVAQVRQELGDRARIGQDASMPPADPSGDPAARSALFRTFLAVNRKLAQATELEDAMGGLLDAAVTLTGGRRGYLLVLHEDGMRREFDSGQMQTSAQAFSRSLAHRAIAEQRTMTGADLLGDEELQAMHSVRNLRVRSAICAPFHSALGTRGAIYVEHAGRSDVFQDADHEALEVLADQAAIAVDRMQREQAMRSELSTKQRELVVATRSSRRRRSQLLGKSKAMAELHKQIDKLADLDLAVLVLGETGTGKELVARALHDRGARRQGPFVAENCSALPAELMERELFGHVEGAFTGADADRPGLLELADGGSLFLDEVGDMSPELQAKLLRALQEREIRRIGGSETIPLNLRLISATHKDVRAMVAAGSFREDLFFRLAAVELQVPPLRERERDVELLAEHFVRQQAEQRGVRQHLAKTAKELIAAYHWPGNVRELEHVIARAGLLADGEEIVDLQLPAAAVTESAVPADGAPSSVITLKEAEKLAIARAMAACRGDKAKAARALGISRTALYDKLKRHELNG